MEEVFATLQMNDFRDVLGAKMSTGMRQKVSIARAIVHDPAGADLRRADRGPRRAGGPVGDAEHRPAARPGQVHPVLDAHHARGGASCATGWPIVSQGQVQACGTLAELRDRYGQNDLEELFFTLVS